MINYWLIPYLDIQTKTQKMIIKFMLYIFKFIATIFSKIGSKYTYTKLYKYLMKYKFVSLIYKPLKYLFNNLIYFIKLTSAIITILSLFNFSLIYYNFDIINEVNNYINEIIKWIKNIISKWLSNDEDEISDPIDFLTYRKEIKVIEKSIQPSSNGYWIIPLMLLGGIGLYFYNPHINLEEITKPIIFIIEDNISPEFPTIFVAGTFIYKFITVSISYITGFKLEPFDDNNDGNNDLNNYKGKSRYSPTDELNNEDKTDYESYFSKIDNEDINTPKASTSNLPEIKSPPVIENPFRKIKFTSESNTSNENKIEILNNKVSQLITNKSIDENKIIEVNNNITDINNDLTEVVNQIDETLRSSIIDFDFFNSIISYINNLNFFKP